MGSNIANSLFDRVEKVDRKWEIGFKLIEKLQCITKSDYVFNKRKKELYEPKRI